uniref:Uncharacterized protein n=1 Tax=Candidatus Kentrum sp. MB TaxID=2138164 RepID=A0A450XLY2_9GAMM|nr:MAG: hypothetical protein BECKMB1821I_GA0114274_10035 [Candidatus Kentron sp. MB]VFK30311.1 MAG: hypothetical protein BECKMB1821G_GA0114241_106219 [Candidatus Kentron sp. MB]VFK74278.1 MAG: hypothetical protein BECKMB1821H_GA0114242_10036 [Candidatus Kentron sp. MB]
MTCVCRAKNPMLGGLLTRYANQKMKFPPHGDFFAQKLSLIFGVDLSSENWCR